jgi:hypothetical protein
MDSPFTPTSKIDRTMCDMDLMDLHHPVTLKGLDS